MAVVVLLFLAAGAMSGQTFQVPATQAHARGDLAGERRILQDAARSGSAADRSEAERRLAWLAWRFYKDDRSAGNHFDRAEAAGDKAAVTLAERSRFLAARGRYRTARELARRALRLAADNWTRDAARRAFAEATVDELLERGRSDATREALDLIAGVVRAEPGQLLPSRLMYGLALAAREPAQASEALRSFYWGVEGPPIYPEAALAGAPAGAVRYGRLCHRVRRVVEEHYRLESIGKPDKRLIEYKVLDEAKRILGVQTVPDLRADLSKRFQAEIGFFRWGLIWGHRTLDEVKTVEQYGHEVQTRYVIIDSLVSSGHVNWHSDGRQSIGGWAGEETIYHIRRDEALPAWMDGADPKRQADLDRRIAAAAPRDDETARANPHAYLEGLMLRLWRRLRVELLSTLGEKGLAGNDLRLAFLREFERLSRQCVISHETRHLIDRRVNSHPNAEFTARLSQVAFAESPAVCLRGIVSPNIGQKDSSHGEANELAMKGIVAWMEGHAGEIRGLDRSRPMLPQFDLLTGQQIRQAFRSMDPLARPAGPQAGDAAPQAASRRVN